MKFDKLINSLLIEEEELSDRERRMQALRSAVFEDPDMGILYNHERVFNVVHGENIDGWKGVVKSFDVCEDSQPRWKKISEDDARAMADEAFQAGDYIGRIYFDKEGNEVNTWGRERV